MPSTPTKTLDDYQIVAMDELVGNNFWCLFDAPGVGKTPPAIMSGYHKRTHTNLPVLITAPAYLLPNWEKEIYAFIPEAVVVRADDTGYHARTEALSGVADFVLTSYNNWGAKVTDKESPDFGKYKYQILIDRPWAAYIFDEGHRLRGRNSNWTKHVFRTRLSKAVNKDTPIWILTGTPFVRDGGDFWPFFHLMDKQKYSSYWNFIKKFCDYTVTPWATKIGNISQARESLFREELSKFSLRRTVADIPQLANLEYQEQTYYVDLPPSVVKMIQKAKKSYVLEHEDLAHPEFLKGSGPLYVKQRQIASVPPTKQNPKINWLREFLSDRTGKVVVYVWFKNTATAISDVLGSQAVCITGEVPSGRRDDKVGEWKAADGPQVLIATIPSLKEGISLTEATDVVFLEHSELPAEIEQCIKRLCRRGQDKVVQVHHVRARKSIDMAIEDVLEHRVDGMNTALKKWITSD